MSGFKVWSVRWLLLEQFFLHYDKELTPGSAVILCPTFSDREVMEAYEFLVAEGHVRRRDVRGVSHSRLTPSGGTFYMLGLEAANVHRQRYFTQGP